MSWLVAGSQAMAAPTRADGDVAGCCTTQLPLVSTLVVLSRVPAGLQQPPNATASPALPPSAGSNALAASVHGGEVLQPSVGGLVPSCCCRKLIVAFSTMLL